MTSLELHYRRLLAIYPPDHRAMYGEEMIAVLMEGSAPGQRFPALGDIADVMVAGARNRFGRRFPVVRDTAWRNGAGIAGLVMALLLLSSAALQANLYLSAFADPSEAAKHTHAIALEVFTNGGPRTLAWLLVVGAAVAGARRLAAWLAGAGLLVEVAVSVRWWPTAQGQVYHFLSVPAMALAAVAALALGADGLPVRVSLTRRGQVLAGAAVFFTAALLALEWLLEGIALRIPMAWRGDVVRLFRLDLRYNGALCLGLLVAAVLAANRKARGTAIVMLLPPAAGLGAWQLQPVYPATSARLVVAAVIGLTALGLALAVNGFVRRGART